MDVYVSPQDHFFNEFAMDGLSQENDEIYLQVQPENLLKSLKMAEKSAKWIKIKLTKKGTPCLTFEIDLVQLLTFFLFLYILFTVIGHFVLLQPTVTNSSRLVTHDVPVHVIPLRQWSDFAEPPVPDFNVTTHAVGVY